MVKNIPTTSAPAERPREDITGFTPTTPDSHLPSETPTRPEPEPTREVDRPREITPTGEKTLEDDTSNVRRVLQSARKKPTTIPVVRDEMTKEVEHILEEGLADAFRTLDPVKKQEFKIKGEQTAIAIRDILRGHKVKVKRILKLIIEWLKIIPGINRFFLEQEAKIKADKIVAIKKKYL